jgi:catechol 2,3-dioxygenase-like lactoylglutathione lyase family enzyme
MKLRNVVVMTRDMEASLSFWRDGLGLAPVALSSAWSELDLGAGTGAGMCLGLKLSETSEAVHSAGYHPQLLFESTRFDEVLYKLLAAHGRLDGPVKHASTGKVAMLRFGKKTRPVFFLFSLQDLWIMS